MSEESRPKAYPHEDDIWGGAQYWRENRAKYTYEQLVPYAGQVVAWYPDGSGVAEVGPDEATIGKRFRERGIDYSLYVFEYFPPLPWDGEL